MGNFVTIGQASDIGEGEMKQVEVAGTKVAIANVAGSCYALGDTCPRDAQRVVSQQSNWRERVLHGSPVCIRQGAPFLTPSR